MTIFGDLDVRLEPWEADYGSELPVDADVLEAAEVVDLDVERPAAGWAAIDVPPQERPADIYFVDGVRRVETRLIVTRPPRPGGGGVGSSPGENGASVLHGALGSYAVGAVRACGGRASWAAERVGRLVVVGGGETLPQPWTLDPALVYSPMSTQATDPDAPLVAIHREMRAAEEALARELAQEAGALVISDGPLAFGTAGSGQALGFVKRLFKLYVPPGALSIVRRLRVGQRSPMFAIRGARRFALYSWFVRLAHPMPVDADLTGLARLEVSEVVGVESARTLADASAAVLPAFVPTRGRDPRAPQNLLPIGALEARLRRRLGDTRLIRRRVTALIARESLHA